MKKLRSLLNITFIVIVNASICSSSYAEVPKFLQKAVIEEKIRDTFLNTSVKFDFDILKGDLTEGISLGTSYSFDVSPSFKQGHQTRMDKWIIEADIRPGDLIPGIVESPFSIGLNKNSSVSFIRQFKTKKEALTAMPYGLDRIPLTAEKVLNKLSVGDLVSFPASMNISIGAKVTTPSILGSLNINRGADVNLFLSGSYNIQVLKMEGSRVRLKIIATSRRGHRAGARFQAGADLFAVEMVDNAINKVHPIALASLGYERGKGKQFVLDYIFDLKYSESRQAYNSILTSSYKFRDVQAALNIFGMDDLNGAIVSTFETADNIYLKDRDSETNAGKRIHRVFKGFNVFKNRGASLTLAALIVKVEGAKNYTEHKLTYRDHQDIEHKYYYPVQNSFWERKSGLTYRTLKERGDISYFGLIAREALNSKTSFSDFGFRYYRQDAKLKMGEQGNLRRILGQTLPESIYQNVDWGENSRKLNTIFSYMIILKENLFKQIPHYTQKNFLNRLKSYVKALKRRRLYFDNNQSNNSPTDENRLNSISNKLHRIVTDSELTASGRLRMLMSMRNDRAFKTFGMGFLISLVPDQSLENLEKLLYVKFKFAGESISTREYTFSNDSKEGLYNQLNAIQRSLNNRSYDLNLSGEMDF